MSDLLAPIIFMMAFVFAEACVLQWTGRQAIDWRDVIFNVNSGHIILWLFRCLEVLCYSMVLSHFSWHLFDGVPAIWLWLFTILAWDFGFYWLHRLHHQIRPLWAVHVVHHQGEHYNLSLGVRNSWYSSLTSIPFFLVLAVLGVPLSVFLTVSIAHYGIQFFNHNALTPKLGWLEKVLITPSHHRVHHLNEKRFADTNYGGTFLVWDKLFGTWCQDAPTENVAYGVKGSQLSSNPMRESNLPFLRLLGVARRDKIRARQFYSVQWMIVTGALLLFALVLGYIARYGYGINAMTSEQALLFALLAAGSVALGGISDGQRWGVIAWCQITVSLPLIYLGAWGWDGAFWFIAMTALALHGVAMAMGLGRIAPGKAHESV